MDLLEAFFSLDIRTGTVTSVEDFPDAKKPLYKLTVNFGPEIGVRRSAAGLKPYYPEPNRLLGKKVVAVINLPPKKIVDFESQCLLLGALDEKSGKFALLTPDQDISNGLKVF